MGTYCTDIPDDYDAFKTLFCLFMKGAALLGGVNALHTAFPENAEEEYKIQGKYLIEGE